MESNLYSADFSDRFGFLIDRVLGTWYYSLFFVLFLVIWIFKQILFNLVVKTFMSSAKSSKTIPMFV